MRYQRKDDLYDRLGIKPTAMPDQLKAAYRAAIRKVHPDVNGGRADATRQAQRLNEAYELLADPAARAAYDRTRKASLARSRSRRRARAKASHRVEPAAPADLGDALADGWDPRDPAGQALLRLGTLIVAHYLRQQGR